MTVPYSSPTPLTLGEISNVNLNYNTLANNDVVKYNTTTQLWENAVGATGTDVDVYDVNNNATYNPTFVAGAGSAVQLGCSNSTWSMNPNTGEFNFVDTMKIDGTGGTGSVDLGLSAGSASITTNRVNVGAGSGQTLQGTEAIAIGSQAGSVNQSASGSGGAIAIGSRAGQTDQSSAALAIGLGAGRSRQGRNSVAIGAQAATVTQPANQICINSSGVAFTGINLGATYINTLRRLDTGAGVGIVSFDPISFELTYSGT